MKIKLSRNNRGSTLLTAVILSAVLITLAAAITTAVLTSNLVSAQNANAQQAYFTARSAVNITKQWIDDNQDKNPALTGDLVASTGETPYTINDLNSSMGKGSVKIEYWDSDSNKKSDTPTNKIKIIGTGKYKGVTRSVSGFMQNVSTFKYTVYMSENLSTKNIAINKGSNIFSRNTVAITQEINAKSITTLEDVRIGTPVDGGTSTIGEIHAVNNVDIGKNVTVTGDVTSGQINGIGNEGTILGKELCQNTDYITLLTNTMKKFTEIDYTLYDKDYPASEVTELNSTYINKSGMISSTDNFNGRNVTVDTSHNDVWIYMGNTLNFKDVKISKKGSHKLYIFLLYNYTVSFDNCKIISDNKISNDIFIFNNGTSSRLVLGNSNTVNACIFLYQAVNLEIVGSGSVINGCVIAGSISADYLLNINYVPPDISGTPIEDCIKNNSDCITYWAFTDWG